MKPLAFTACFFLLLIGVSSAQTNTTTKGSTIRGRVTYDDTDKPARRLGVALFSDSKNGNQKITFTDAKGEFVFKNVAAGTYRVVAGFAGRTNGFPMNEVDMSNAVEITTDGSSSNELKIRATRAGSITGRITYPDGEAVTGAQVSVYRREGNRWVRAAIATSSNETDDRGIFRLYPLLAGEYAISVIERGIVTEVIDDQTIQTTQNSSINPYFYQNGTNLKTATNIQVESGREVSNINITLTERATYEVSGTVMSKDKPVPGFALTLNVDDGGLGGPTLMQSYGPVVTTDSDGRWSFKGIPDGVYKLEPAAFRTNTPLKFLWKQQPVTVIGSDQSGIVLNLTEGATISGSVMVEGGKTVPHYSVNLELPADRQGTSRWSSRVSSSESNSSFSVDGVAEGEVFLSVQVDKGYFVKSLTYKGRDLRRLPLIVEAGQEITGINAVLSSDVGSLQGRVISSQTSKAIASGAILLFPVDESLWTGRNGLIYGTTDGEGNFKVSGAPGDYRVVAIPNKPGRYGSLEPIKEIARRAQRVTLKTTPQDPVDVVVP